MSAAPLSTAKQRSATAISIHMVLETARIPAHDQRRERPAVAAAEAEVETEVEVEVELEVVMGAS